jgi:Fasciclin domain
LTSAFFIPESHTIFAPTDDAFAKLENITDDVETLLYVIGSHIVPGLFDSSSFFDGQVLTTLSEVNLTVSVSNETGISIAGSTVVLPDLFASNGIIHGIGALFLSVISIPNQFVTPRTSHTPFVMTDTIILPFSSEPPTSAPTTPLIEPVASASSVSFYASFFFGLLAMMV